MKIDNIYAKRIGDRPIGSSQKDGAAENAASIREHLAVTPMAQV